MENIPYQNKIIEVLISLVDSDINCVISFNVGTKSITAHKKDVTPPKKLSLTKENIKEMINQIGGITLENPVELFSPAGGNRKLQGCTHIFGDATLELLYSTDWNDQKLYLEIIAKLTGEYTKNFTKERFLYVAECDTNISYTDYYNNKSLIEGCCENIFYK